MKNPPKGAPSTTRPRQGIAEEIFGTYATKEEAVGHLKR